MSGLDIADVDDLRDWWDGEREGDSSGSMLGRLDATVARIVERREVAAVEAFRASLVTTIEAAIDAYVTTAGLPTFIATNVADAERTGRLVGLSAAARIVADHPIAKES